MRRRITAVTSSRADYSHLHWLLKDLAAHPGIDLRVIATGAQLSGEFGRAVEELEKDSLAVDERIECLLSSDTDVGMAKTIGVATLGFADALARSRPDLLVLIADRYEMLAPASVALALRVPVAHIEGGEVSEGAIDNAVRNALTKLSHLHFTATENSRRRVLAMGEEAWRVHHAGALSLDHLRRSPLLVHSALEADLGMRIEPDAVVVAYHPVTLALDTLCEVDELFAALDELPQQLFFCFPNPDAGSRSLIARVRNFCRQRSHAAVFVNLHPIRYWSLLRCVGVMVGNSSSGIMETPSIPLPTVNVGMRQQGRERARNVLDAPPDACRILEAVRRALDPAFRRSIEGTLNPYGDGRASERITEILASTPLGERLLHKKTVPLESRRDQGDQ